MNKNNFEDFEKEFPMITHYRAYNFGKSLTLLVDRIKRLLKV